MATRKMERKGENKTKEKSRVQLYCSASAQQTRQTFAVLTVATGAMHFGLVRAEEWRAERCSSITSRRPFLVVVVGGGAVVAVGAPSSASLWGKLQGKGHRTPVRGACRAFGIPTEHVRDSATAAAAPPTCCPVEFYTLASNKENEMKKRIRNDCVLSGDFC